MKWLLRGRPADYDDRDSMRCSRYGRMRPRPAGSSGTLLRYGDVSPSHRETFERGCAGVARGWRGAKATAQGRRPHHARSFPSNERGDSMVLDSAAAGYHGGPGRCDASCGTGCSRGCLSSFCRCSCSGMAAGSESRQACPKLTGAGLVHNPSYPGSAVEVRERAGLPRFIL